MSLTHTAVGILALGFLAAELPSADDAAIRTLISAFEQAENKHDGKAIASLFVQDSPDRDPVSKRIVAEGGAWTERSPVRYKIDALRTVHPDTALVDTTATWYQSGLLHGSSQQTMVLVKDHGEWKISAYRTYRKRL